MPSDWFKQYMQQFGLDVEDEFFENKLKAYKPPESFGLFLPESNDVRDYFESGGEYDKAAGNLTGLTANVADLGLRAGKGLIGGLVGAAGVVTDLADKAATEISDLTGLEKGGLFGEATQSARSMRSDWDTAVSEGMAMPTHDFSLADPLGNYKDVDSVGDFATATKETVQDVLYGTAEVGADMLGAAATGYVLGPAGFQGGAAAELAEGASLGAKALAYGKDVLASNVSKGFQASSFADMYEKHTQGKEDSGLKALAIAAPYSQFTGLLEGIGAVETFGERAVSKYLVGDSITSWMGRRAAATALGATSEGATEYPQQWLQILAEELPSNSVNDKSPISAWERIKQRSPETWQAALGGALFGGTIGGIKGLGKVGEADADANANNGNTPKEQAAADLINGKKNPETTNLTNMAETILTPDIKTPEIAESTAKTADEFIKASEKRDDLLDSAKQDALDAKRLDTANIQQASEEKTQEVTSGMIAAVDTLANDKLAQFDNIVLGLQNFMQSMATNQAQQLPGAPDQESTDLLAKMAQSGLDPQKVAQAVAKQLEEIGVNPEVFADGIQNVDMSALRDEFAATIKKEASSRLLPVAEEIEKAREPEPDSPVAQDIAALKQAAGPQDSPNSFYEKAVEALKGQQTVTVAYLQRSLNIGFKRATALMEKLEGDKLVAPKAGRAPRQVLLTPEELAAPASTVLHKKMEVQESAKDPVAKPSPKEMSPIESVAKKLLSYVKDKASQARHVIAGGRVAQSSALAMNWLVKPFRLEDHFGHPEAQDMFSDDPDTLLKLQKVHGPASEQEFASAVSEQIKSDLNVSDNFHTVVTEPFSQKIARLRSRYAKALAAPNRPVKDPVIANIKTEMRAAIRTFREAAARQHVPPGVARTLYDAGVHIINEYRDAVGFDTAKKELEFGVNVFYGNDEKSAATDAVKKKDVTGEYTSAAKIVSHWLYTHASPELSTKMVARMLGQKYTMEEDNALADQLATELASDGLFEGLPKEDPFTKRAFMESITNLGKSVSSPHGMYNALVEAGESPLVAMSTVAGLHAASINAFKSKGTSYSEFWDRLSDNIIAAAKVQAETRITEGLYNPGNPKNRQSYLGERISLFANNIINLFGKTMDNVKNAPTLVMQHEIMHALHSSGLLLDILGEDGILALEDAVGGILYDANGKPMLDDEETAERLAVSWEIFLATQQAPNAVLQPIFESAKNFFRTYLNFLLGMIEKTFNVKMWEIQKVGLGKLPFRIGKGQNDTYSNQYQALLDNQPAISALHRIFNVEPEIGAHMSTGGLTGATGALLTELSEMSGVDMTGAFDPKPLNRSVLVSSPVSWTPESGVAPTDDQMVDMLGYSGMNIEDQGVQNSLKHHKATTGVRMKIWALPKQKVFTVDELHDTEFSPELKEALVKYINYWNSERLGSESQMITDINHPKIILDGLKVLQQLDSELYKKYAATDIADWFKNNIRESSVFIVSSVFPEDYDFIDKGVKYGVGVRPWFKKNVGDIKTLLKLPDDEMVGLDKEKLVGPAVHVFPKDRVVKAENLPTAEEANQTRWYHGSWVDTLHEVGMSTLKSGKRLLYGPGVYLTDDPVLAESYRKSGERRNNKEGDVYALKVNIRNIINLEEPINADVANALLKAIHEEKEHTGYNGELISFEDKVGGYSDDGPYNTFGEAIRGLMSFYPFSEEILRRLEVNLRKDGYDAYTHIGGQHMGRKDHRVIILLDPTNELSNEYPPTVVKNWPTRRTPVEHGPFLRKSAVGVDKVESKKQQLALKIMEKAGTARSSLDAQGWLQGVYDGWVAGRNNPAFNNEEMDNSAPSVTTLMSEYARLWRKWIEDPSKTNEVMAEVKKILPFTAGAHLRGVVDLWTGTTKNLANAYAPLEDAVMQIGLPAVKRHVNNMYSLAHWASQITERVPQYFDRTVGQLGDWVKILGSESWRSIDDDFVKWKLAYFAKYNKEIPDKTTRRFHKRADRDLKLWMLAQRELEIFNNSVKLVDQYRIDLEQFHQDVRDGKAGGEGPKPPKIPQISGAAVALAKNVISVMKMTYGEDINKLDEFALRFSKWETDSKLVPLLHANMITQKQYNDIVTSGLRHVPLHRIRELIDSTGALNPKIDGSMYEVLDYLKRDLAFKVEDPMAAAIASVQAINMLVQRQIAKNAIGEHVKENVPIGTGMGEFVMLHSKKKITKAEYDKLPEAERHMEKAKPAGGKEVEVEDAHEKYYQIVPATKDDVDAIIKKFRERMKGLEGQGGREAKKKLQQAEIMLEGGIFAAYLEPGVPTYFRITDATVAEAFYLMNNPQAMYAKSALGRMLAQTQRWFKGNYVTSPQFVWNMIWRDIPNAILRSKHGLRLSDIARGVVASLDMAGFEDIGDKMDFRSTGQGSQVSGDALQGFGPFGGLVSAVGTDGNLDIDLLMAASHDSVKSRNSNIVNRIWSAYVGNLKKHGVAFPSLSDISEATKKGDWSITKDVVTLVPKLVFSLPQAIMSVPGSVLENAPRLAERRLMMDVNITKDFPSLLERFPDRYTPDANGQVYAGYAGTIHRRKWEAAAKRLKADPNAVVAKEDLPIQYGAMEKDYDTRHITLPFDQKGKWTPMIDLGHIFFGPAMLDMYTNITQIGNNSATQAIADLMRTKEQIIERKKNLNYNVADILGKQIKYTDQDARALAMMIKAIGVITIPALAQAVLYRDDDEWQAQSFAEKLSYYHIKSPWGGRFRIARGLGFMQLLFSDLPTAAILEFSGKDPKAFNKWWNRFFQSTPLGAVLAGPMAYANGISGGRALMTGINEAVPEALKGTTEALISDYDPYREKQVSYETGFAPEDETRVKSDRFNILANMVARIERVQPAQAQHQIEAMFPGTKKVIPWLANKSMETVTDATGGLPPEVQPSNAPIYGQAMGGPIRFYSKSPFGVGNEFVQSLYKLNRELTGYKNTLDNLPETSQIVYKSQHPELKYQDLIEEAVNKINEANKEVFRLRKEGLKKSDNGMTEYDLNKQMTVQAMEAYRLFYGKLLGEL